MIAKMRSKNDPMVNGSGISLVELLNYMAKASSVMQWVLLRLSTKGSEQAVVHPPSKTNKVALHTEHSEVSRSQIAQLSTQKVQMVPFGILFRGHVSTQKFSSMKWFAAHELQKV